MTVSSKQSAKFLFAVLTSTGLKINMSPLPEAEKQQIADALFRLRDSIRIESMEPDYAESPWPE